MDDDPIFRSILGVPGMAGTSKSFMCGKGSFHIVKESQGEREAERARERGERAYELAVNVAKQKCGFSQPATACFYYQYYCYYCIFNFKKGPSRPAVSQLLGLRKRTQSKRLRKSNSRGQASSPGGTKGRYWEQRASLLGARMLLVGL